MAASGYGGGILKPLDVEGSTLEERGSNNQQEAYTPPAFVQTSGRAPKPFSSGFPELGDERVGLVG